MPAGCLSTRDGFVVAKPAHQNNLRPSRHPLTRPMVDIDLIVHELQRHGHTVEDVHSVSHDAGDYEMIIDGVEVNIEGARRVLEADQADQAKRRQPTA